MKKLVLFDLDGTLTNTSYDIADSVNKTLRQFGYPEITLEEAIKFVGNGARKLIERSLKGAPCDNFDEVLDRYNEIYNYCGSPKTYVYDGMKDVMKRLVDAGFMLAIISNKPQAGTDEVVKTFFSDIPLSYVFGQREGIKTKPDRACVDFVLKELKISGKDAVFVGDSDVDAMTAINAGIDGVCVLWGYRPKEILEEVGAKTFVSTPEELYEKILSL